MFEPLASTREERLGEFGDQNISYLTDCNTGERRQVLPNSLLHAKVLILMLDQGQIGMAGVAFGAFK